MPLLALLHHLRTAVKTRKAARILFPIEKWIKIEPYIWVAQSRLIQRTKEKEKWDREISQVRILTSRGSVAYFLPDMELKGESGKRCADLVLDGVIMEMKTVSGTRATLGGEFRLAFKQGAGLLKICSDLQKHSVFICLLSDLSVVSVKAKAAGELKERQGFGSFICYFDRIQELHTWTYNELRAFIRPTKNNPAHKPHANQ
jgi:hypothetical protein